MTEKQIETEAGSADVLMELRVSDVRRVFALCVLIILGMLLLWNALLITGAPILLQLFLVALGLSVLALAEKMRRNTVGGLTLTQEALWNADGSCLVRMEDVVSIERGVFAFKPSNGFMINTRSAGGRFWAPGLVWRVGKRIGIGGITNARDAKSMVEVIVALTTEE
ncbi:hypothetical protein [Halocynthiibacter namhaensis]|uniref:hypothetical protein n=1 Tax=Halocynthiibacter namhaensis TaxID=1290553 RepID=UPI00068E0300|nr:hypothetical protein [Halocynthiibacter namhaensis]